MMRLPSFAIVVGENGSNFQNFGSQVSGIGPLAGPYIRRKKGPTRRTDWAALKPAMPNNTAKTKERKIRRPSPLQAERELAALKRLYNEEDAGLMTGEEYDALKAGIMGRLTGRAA